MVERDELLKGLEEILENYRRIRREAPGWHSAAERQPHPALSVIVRHADSRLAFGLYCRGGNSRTGDIWWWWTEINPGRDGVREEVDPTNPVTHWTYDIPQFPPEWGAAEGDVRPFGG